MKGIVLQSGTRLAACFLAISNLLADSTQSYDDVWHCSPAQRGEELDIVADHDLVIDHAGVHHTVFLVENSSGGTDVMYRYLHDLELANWSLQTKVVSGGNAIYEQLAIMVGDDGVVHVSCVSPGILGAGKLHYLRRDPSGVWSDSEVADDASRAQLAGTSIDLDAAGSPVIAYTGHADNELRLAVSGFLFWSQETADPNANSGFEPSLQHFRNSNTTGGEDYLAIAHYDQNNTALKVSRFGSYFDDLSQTFQNSWINETANDVADTGRGCCLRREGDGRLGVSCLQISPGITKVLYLRENGGSWNPHLVDASDDEGDPDAVVGFDTALEMDASGLPRILYAKGVGNGLGNPPLAQEMRVGYHSPVRWPFSLFFVHERVLEFSGNDELRDIEASVNSGGTVSGSFFHHDLNENVRNLLWTRPYQSAWVGENLSSNSVASAGVSVVGNINGESSVFYSFFNGNSWEGSAQQARKGEPWLERSVNDLNVDRSVSVGSGDGWIHRLFLIGGTSIVHESHHLQSGTISRWPISNQAANEEIALVLGADGFLHAAFSESSGKVACYRARPPGNAGGSPVVWTKQMIPGSPSGAGVGISQSQSGILGLSYFEQASEAVRLILRDRSGVWTDQEIANVAASPFESGVATTEIAFNRDQPVVGWVTNAFGTSTISLLDGTGSEYGRWNVAGDIATIRMKSDHSGTFHLAYRANEGPLDFQSAHVGYLKANSGAQSIVRVATFDNDGLDIYQPHRPEFDGFSLDLDRDGMPIIAIGVSLTNGGRVAVLRPGDALDDDLDGVPLLLENAFRMNSAVPDRELLPTPTTGFFGRGLEIEFEFRHPFLGSPHYTTQVLVGEFRYEMTGSTDLDWFQQPHITGAETAAVMRSSSLSPIPHGVSAIKSTFSSAFRNSNPNFFTRLEVGRVVPLR